MAAYDALADKLDNIRLEGTQETCSKAAEIIRHLQSVIRGYNPDDETFDDEKRLYPMSEMEVPDV